MTRFGIVTGLTVEAARIEAACRRFPASEKPYIGVAGGSADRAAHLSREHVAAGVQGLVSFGVAGGLDPSLKPGDIVVGTAVWCGRDAPVIETSVSWARSIAAAFQGECPVHTGIVAGVDEPVTSATGKDVLRSHSAALAVDMESHGIAGVALESGIPLLVIRAIADPAMRVIPSAALVGMGPDGGRRPWAVLRMLLVHPQEIPGIIRLARDSSAAIRSLSIAAERLMTAG